MKEKNTYRIKEMKNGYTFMYSGDLTKVIEKAERDLDHTVNNKDVENWIWIKNRADKAIESNRNRIERLKAFIKRAKQELEEKEKRE